MGVWERRCHSLFRPLGPPSPPLFSFSFSLSPGARQQSSVVKSARGLPPGLPFFSAGWPLCRSTSPTRSVTWGPGDQLGKPVGIAQVLSILGPLLLRLWGRVPLSQTVWPVSVCLVVVVGEGSLFAACCVMVTCNGALPCSSRDFLSVELDTWGSR